MMKISAHAGSNPPLTLGEILKVGRVEDAAAWINASAAPFTSQHLQPALIWDYVTQKSAYI